MNNKVNNFFKTIFIQIIVIVSLLSCGKKENQQKIIPLDINSYTDLKITDISKEIIEIPLEFTKEAMIGTIGKIEFTNEAIYVHDLNNSRVLKFSNSGKFIQQIGKKGNGPGEYQFMNSFAVNPREETIYIATQGRIILYDLKGKFKQDLKDFGFVNYIAFIENELKIFSSKFGFQEKGSDQLYNLEILKSYNSEMEQTDSLLIKKIAIQSVSGTVFPQAKYFSKSEDEYFFYMPVLINEPLIRDTLYKFNNMQLSFYKKLDFESQADPKAKHKTINIKSIIKTDKYLISEYLNDGNRVFIYDLDNSKGYNLKEGLDASDFTLESNVSLFPILNEENKLYFTGKPISSKSESFEPNASIFKVKLN